MTGRNLIAASLRLIGVLAAGETPKADEATDGLATLNRMISSWSTENLLIYAITAETPLTLTPADGSYTMGVSGDFTNRPQEIVRALIRDGSTDYPVELITVDQYAAIPDKTTQSTYPQKLYDDGGYPQRTIKLWPVPDAAKSLVLYTKRILTEIATLDTALSFPPGYERALVSNGAQELASEYGKTVPDSVAIIAVDSKAAIKRANIKSHLLRCDGALLGGGGGFNIYTGESR